MQSNRLPVLAAEIRKAHADVHEAAKTAAQRAIDAGHALIEAKSLCQHGEWLPWLREHCALAERTAQLYMKIAKSGLESASVADLGLNAAAKAITLQYPDPFAEDSEEEISEWCIFALMLMQHGICNEGATHHCEWLRRNGWGSRTEWFGPDGDKIRKVWGVRSVSQKAKDSWTAFLAEHQSWPKSKIDAEVLRITAEQDARRATEPPLPRRKRRRRRAA